MWTTDIGRIGDLVILSGYEDTNTLAAERDRALRSDDPFGSASVGARLIVESYASFDFLPDPEPRDYGGMFEMWTYHLVPGGLLATMAGWEAAIGPARRYTDHLVAAFFDLDGDLRITQIWGFRVSRNAPSFVRSTTPKVFGRRRVAPSTSVGQPRR